MENSNKKSLNEKAFSASRTKYILEQVVFDQQFVRSNFLMQSNFET